METHIADLVQNGYVTIPLFTLEEAHSLKNQLFREVESVTSTSPPFFEGVPRVLGGMIKFNPMLQTLHDIRKHARPKFYEVVRSLYEPRPDLYERLIDFEVPSNPDELTCNPDGFFISDNKRDVKYKKWWHIDASREKSFIQASVVLDNPENSEEFAVIEGSHLHFDVLAQKNPLNDWYMLDDEDITRLVDERSCRVKYMRPAPGTMVLWFSNLVHTVRAPTVELENPRVLTYVCFGKLPDSNDFMVKNVKTAAVMLGAACRHLPYPCVPELNFDILLPSEKPREIVSDLNDLSIYGLSRSDVLEAVESWIDEEPFYQTFLDELN